MLRGDRSSALVPNGKRQPGTPPPPPPSSPATALNAPHPYVPQLLLSAVFYPEQLGDGKWIKGG